MTFKQALKPFAGLVPPVSASGVGPTSGFPVDPPAAVPSGPPRASDPSSSGVPPETLRKQSPLHQTIGVEYFRVDPTLSEILNSLDPVQAVGPGPPAGITQQRPRSRPVPIYAPGDSVSKAPSGMNLTTAPLPSPPEHPVPDDDIGVIF